MPANWPTFILNLSGKIESRDSESRKEFAEIFAEEYLNAVKTAQTPFGNTHSQGQKIILEEGFHLAFETLMQSIPPDFPGDLELHKKLTDDRYVDLVEPLPEGDVSFDPHCELEKWTLENSSKLEKFNFYPFFNSTCPLPEDPEDLSADFNFKLIKDSIEDFNSPVPSPVALFYLINFDNSQNYKIRYELNGKDQGTLTTDQNGQVSVQVPQQPGKYSYRFVDILNSDGDLIKHINKSRSVTIGSTGDITQLDSIDTEMGLNIDQPEVKERINRLHVPEMTEDEKIDFIAQRVAFQRDGSKRFEKWVDRLSKGYHKDFGKAVKQRVRGVYKNVNKKNSLDLSSSGVKNTINQYMFQEEHIDQPGNIPEWLVADLIAKFVYIKGIDNIKTTPKAVYNRKARGKKEKKRIDKKVKLYENEKKRFRDLQRMWAKAQEDKFKQEQESEDNSDPYNIMAGAIIAYWISTLAQPFRSAPPVLPCNIPSPGTFIPLYYGSRKMLANDLRRAFNMGKIFTVQPATPIASKLVASAVAVACAKHLLMLKFLYIGQFSTPVGPIPMVGFVPLAF